MAGWCAIFYVEDLFQGCIGELRMSFEVKRSF